MKEKNKLIRVGYIVAALIFLIEIIILVINQEITWISNLFLIIASITLIVTSSYAFNIKKKRNI